MANFDLVFPYDRRLEEWLRERGYPCPGVAANNRFPTKAEVIAAACEIADLTVEDSERDEFHVVRRNQTNSYEVRVGSRSWEELGKREGVSITMKGSTETEVALLHKLASVCGQLVLYPDSGSPPAIVEPQTDPAKLVAVLFASRPADDSWEYLFAHAYGTADG